MLNMNFYRKYLVKTLLAVSIVLMGGACAEEVYQGYQSLMQTEFHASLYEWDDYEIAATRAAKDSLYQTVSIPVYSDDGEEYELTITSEKDTTWEDSVIQESITRTTLVNYSDIKGKKFRCYAYVNGDGEADKVLINGVDLTINSTNGAWLPTSGTQYEWPSPTQVITFYGIIPSTTAFSTRDKTVTFTQNTTAESQTDLLIAASEPLNQAKDANTSDEYGNEIHKAIPIKFRHALTAVKFKASSNLPGATLQSIQLTGFYSSGIYTLPIGDKNGSWITTGSTTTFTAQPNSANMAISASTNNILNDNTHTFLMIPQSMAKSKKLVLNVTAGGASRTLTANFNGLPAWTPGTKVIYTLGKKANTGWYIYTDKYLPSGGQYHYMGAGSNSVTHKVTSYSLTTTSSATVSKTAQPWKLIAYNRGSGWVNWTSGNVTDNIGRTITLTATSGNGNTDAALSTGDNFIFSRNQPPTTYSGPRITVANSIAGTSFSNNTEATAVDLSTFNVLTKTTIAKSTANCYIVNGVGYFKFPTVYGNGYKNGSVNYRAFKTTNASSGTNMFKNHLNAGISSPDISVPSGATAKIIWMDYELQGCIDNVSYANNYITFQIKSSTNLIGSALVPPGNIVLGLFNGTDCIWQWHIYLFNADQGNRDLGKTYVGHQANIQGSNITFRLQQTNNSNSYTEVQTIWYGSETLYNNRVRSLNYVWGFPRPLPATEQTNGTYENYNNDGTTKKAKYVNTPSTYNIETYNNATNNSSYASRRWDGTIKTIFDPSPRGYRVPTSAEFGTIIKIGDDAPYVSGWGINDGGVLAIPYGATEGYYLSSNVENLIKINSTKSLNRVNGTITSQGMVHPVTE